MVAHLVVGMAAALGIGQLRPVESPPMPDFKTAVDYRAWYDKQTTTDPGQNALDMYGVFLYAGQNSPNAQLLPKPGTDAADQLKALAGEGRVWRAPNNQALHKWLLDMDARFHRAFVDGAERSQYAPRPSTGIPLIVDIKPPLLANARAVSQMMFARAWLAQGHVFYTDPYIEAMKSNLALARHLSSGPSFEEQIFAIGHRDFVYLQMIEALRSRVFGAEFWGDIADVMKEQDSIPIPESYARSLYFSEAQALQLLQHFCTDYRSSSEPIVSSKINRDPVEAYFKTRYESDARRPAGVQELLNADPVALARSIHDYYEGMRAILRSPVASNLKERTAEVNKATFGKQPAMSALMMPIDMSVRALYRTEARRRMAYMFVRKAIEFKKTNKWPMAYDELDAADIASYRTDPFTGQDFLFAPRRDRTAFYSVGADGVDNGGDSTRDVVFWTVVMKDATEISAPSPAPEDSGTDNAGDNGDSGNKEGPSATAEETVPVEERPEAVADSPNED